MMKLALIDTIRIIELRVLLNNAFPSFLEEIFDTIRRTIVIIDNIAVM